MSTKSTKSAVVVTDTDAASTAILAAMVKAHDAIEGTALSIIRLFAADMEAGTLSLNGAKATLDKAEADNKAVAGVRKSYAQHFVLMAKLSHLQGAPEDVRSIYTLADRLIRSSKAQDGKSKSDVARSVASQAVAKGAKFDTLNARTPKQAEIGKKSGAKKSGAEKSAEPVTMTGRVRDLRAWLESAPFDALTAEMQEALVMLGAVIHERMAELAE